MNASLTFRHLFVNKVNTNRNFRQKYLRKERKQMKVQNKSRSRVIKFLNGKAFYVVLCLCFLAIGVAAWSGVEGMRRLNKAENGQQESQASDAGSKYEFLQTLPSESTPVHTDESKVDEPENPSETETAVTSQPETEETAAPVATYFINPVLGDIIKDFSDSELQYSMTMRDMRLHCGVDIAADAGTPVIAAGEGTVTSVYTDAMYGTVVEIDHGNGITAKYCGLNAEPCVKNGDRVDTSTQIGAVDVIPCESVEQRHLHLEFYKNGKAVSPLNYIEH